MYKYIVTFKSGKTIHRATVESPDVKDYFVRDLIQNGFECTPGCFIMPAAILKIEVGA